MKKLGFVLGVLGWFSPAFGEEIPTITAVMENGPSEHRINVVFLSEAYVAKHRETYFSDVQIATDSLFQFTPFKEYRNYFNVYAIWVASQDSFLAVVARGEEPKTYFGEWGGLSPSVEKVYSVSRSFFGGVDTIITVLLVNDDRETASGINKRMTIGTGRFHHDPDITNLIYASSVIHEFGHAFGGLNDEYDGLLVLRGGETDKNYPGGPFVNVTTETNRDRVRWKHWIEPATPVPTPKSRYNDYTYAPDGSIVSWTVRDTSVYADKVGLFEGAFSFNKSWYRPKLNCAMRGERGWNDKLPSFCEVCRETLVLEIYRQVDPTAAFDAAVGDASTVFSINLPTPTDHNLSIQWLVDGAVVPRQNSSRLEVTDQGVGYGRHIVTVTVEDTTEWVRMDTVGLLVRSLEWRPIVYYPSPDFTGDGAVDFDDFFMFADAFGRPKTKAREKFDLDWDGAIDFNDFFLFADAFGSQ